MHPSPKASPPGGQGLPRRRTPFHEGQVSVRLTTLLHDILTSRVYDVARETPVDAAAGLSSRLGNAVLLKREDLQH